MNERIEKLVKEAGLSYVMVPTNPYIKEDLTKFTELIIQEFIQVVKDLKVQYRQNRKNAFEFEEKEVYAEGASACDTILYKTKIKFGVQL
jgi:hypothetical protein